MRWILLFSVSKFLFRAMIWPRLRVAQPMIFEWMANQINNSNFISFVGGNCDCPAFILKDMRTVAPAHKATAKRNRPENRIHGRIAFFHFSFWTNSNESHEMRAATSLSLICHHYFHHCYCRWPIFIIKNDWKRYTYGHFWSRAQSNVNEVQL